MTTAIIQNTTDSGIPADNFHNEMAEALREPEPDLPLFTQAELSAMHRYCLKYSALVRGDGTPTREQDERFMLFQRICYVEGIARG